MKYLPKSNHRHRGFSLVELLVVIAVIGVISAIAIPSLGIAHENAREVIAKRNAQQIASTFGAGEATGAPGFKTANSVTTAMNVVGTGSWGAGINTDTFFQVPGVSATMDDAKPVNERAFHYLTWTGTSLVYVEDGVNEPPPPPVNNNPWYLLIIIPVAQGPSYTANQDQMHVGDEHRWRDLGNGWAAIEYRAKVI